MFLVGSKFIVSRGTLRAVFIACILGGTKKNDYFYGSKDMNEAHQLCRTYLSMHTKRFNHYTEKYFPF
jgi:hypothetical protein